MPHTPDQRSQLPLCGSRKKNGTLCRAFAGQATDHPGVGRCKWHGGNTPSGKKNAIAIEAKRNAVRMGVAKEVAPAEALLLLNHVSSGQVAYLQERISELGDDLAGHDAQVLLRLWDEERDRLARIAKACLDAGAEPAQLRLIQRLGAQLVTMLEGIKGDLGLTADQQRAWPDIIKRWWEMAASMSENTPDFENAAAEAGRREWDRKQEMSLRRQQQARDLGLWEVGDDPAAIEARNDRLAARGFRAYDSDSWERWAAEEETRRRGYPVIEG